MKLNSISLLDFTQSNSIVRTNNNKNAYNNKTFLQTLPCDTVSFTADKKPTSKQVIILLGAPNSGKGTYASRISGKYDIPQISTGEILRKEVKADSKLGQKAKSYMDAGELVPDNIIIKMIENRTIQPDCEKGFILDGFPRTVEQAQKLDEMLAKEKNVDLKIVNLDVAKNILYERSARRYFCEDCGKTYSIENYDENAKCDCGGRLVKRADDTPEVLTKRLEVYDAQTMPLLEYYGDKVSTYKTTEAFSSIEENVEKICDILES